MNPTVVFDFDGVIHSYVSGWKGETVIPDPPVPGIREAIISIREAGYRVVVVSTRCKSADGIRAIRTYLCENDIEVDDIVAEKPPAIVYIDDRAIRFDGHPETLLSEIKNFKVWNKSDTMYNKCKVLGKDCIFTTEKISYDDFNRLQFITQSSDVRLNQPLEKLEVKHNGTNVPIAVETDVTGNFYGTIIIKENFIDFRNENYYVDNGSVGININPDDIEIHVEMVTLKEYLSS